MSNEQPDAERTGGGETCQRCGSAGDDRRTLWMACFYAMHELGLPFDRELMFRPADPATDCFETVTEPTTIHLSARAGLPARSMTLAPGTVRCSGALVPHDQYTLRVCKRCRGEWLEAIKTWFHAAPRGDDHDADDGARTGCGSGIFIRENGALLEITREEWDRRAALRDAANAK